MLELADGLLLGDERDRLTERSDLVLDLRRKRVELRLSVLQFGEA